MGLKVRKQESVPQASRIFTDREIPRKSFWKNYHDFKSKMNDGDIKVLAYYGIGGIGKSTLLRKLISEMDEAQASGTISKSYHVYFDFNLKQDFKAALENIKNKLVEDYSFDFPLFDLGCYIYAKKVGDHAEKHDTQTYISKSKFLNLAFDIAKEIPVVGLAAKILNIADKSLAIYRNTFEKHKDSLLKIEGLSTEELYEYLPVLFAKDLSANMEDKTDPLVVFLDTYEQLVNEMSAIGEPLNNDLFLRDENDGVILNSPKVLWVIAGREKLKWQRFLDWGDSLEQHILGNLSNTDAQNFLMNAGINDEGLRLGIYSLTQGTPVYLDLCVDRYVSLLESGRTPRIEDFGQDIYALIERFARYMDDSKKDVVYILSCMRLWNDEMVLEIGPKVLPNFSLTTYEKVKGFSFIIESEKNHYNLHQTVCDTLYKNCPESIKQKTISAAIEYCKSKLESESVFSSDFEYFTGWLMKYAIDYFEEDEQLRVFYIEQIRQYLKKLSDVRRFNAIDDLFEPFWERASLNKEARLYALAQKDYSIWLQSKGKYQVALDMAKNSYDLYVKLLGEDDVATLRAQREYGNLLKLVGRYHESLDVFTKVWEKRKQILGEYNVESLESCIDICNAYGKMGDYSTQLGYTKKLLEIREHLFDANSPEVFKSRGNFGKIYQSMGRYNEALEVFESLVEESERILGPNDEETIDIVEDYAVSLKKLGRYDEALVARKRVYEGRFDVLGENHPDTLSALVSLAAAYNSLGQYEQSLSLREKVLEKRRVLLGELHPDTLKGIWGVAYNLEQLGRYQEALVLRQEIYEKYKQTQGEDFPDTIKALANIAGDYKDLGDYNKNLELRKEVYERRLKNQGENHPDTLSALTTLATAYNSLGQYEQGLSLKEKVLEKRRVLLGELHPDTLKGIWGVAYNLEQLGRYQEALVLRQEIYEKYKQTQGEDFPDTIDALANVADDYKDLGDYDKNLELRKDVYERRSKNQGENHPDTLSALVSLAAAYERLGRYEQGLALREKVLEKRRVLLGELHPDTLKGIWGVAYNLEQLGRYQEALVLRQEIYEKYKQTQGEDFPDTIDALANVAGDYKNLGDFEKALNIRKGICERLQSLYGYEHPKSISARVSLAILYENMGRFDDAIVLQKERLEIRRRTRGENSVRTIAALNGLAWAHFLGGSFKEGLVYAEEMRCKMKENSDVGARDEITFLDTLVLLYASDNMLDNALSLANELLNKTLDMYGSDEKFIAARRYALAFALNKKNMLDDALQYAQLSYDVRKKYLGDFNEATIRSKTLLDEIKGKKTELT